MIVKLCKQNR